MKNHASAVSASSRGSAERAADSREGVLCQRCVMHDGLSGITLDTYGICTNCAAFDEILARYPLGEEGRVRLEAIVASVRRAGSGRRYDCVVGVSGGTDSTYTLYMARRLGLRPLAVHFDNGWNTEVAVRNIKGALQSLDVDLWTYVVDWEEFKDLQLSFLKAGVPSVEVPTDLAIWSVLYRAAARFGVRYILSGNCFRAEGVVPHAWGFKDARLIQSIQRQFGTAALRSFPNFPLSTYAWYSLIRRVKFVRLLNYVDYGKEEAKETLTRELGWIDYGGHHHESIYTRFFQAYLAREKFNMDRRRVSLSARVRLHKISRNMALDRLKDDDYAHFLQEDDKKYVAKKLGIGMAELDDIVAQSPRAISTTRATTRSFGGFKFSSGSHDDSIS
jgi:N-acetyl sugar amidotransferase